ncbi:MAG: chromate resistance protein [Candidatus Rokubacteria bacterium]|nr:chromate resistance protein [Candidatus Rokubacteria bacterium]
MRWLALLINLPTRPTRHRVAAWRKLKRIGAVKLKGAAWLLPDTPETAERFQWLVGEIQSAGGEAVLLRVERIETMSETDVTALFHRERAPEYEAVARALRDILAQLDRATAARRGAPAPLARRVEALGRELDRIQAIDYVGSPLGRRPRALLETAARRVRALEAPPAAERRPRARGLPPAGSTWVTRPRPHIDRLASAWLVKRFVDPDARFAFADPVDAAKKGVPFDIPGAEFSHQGDDCTFETLMRRAGLRDRRLAAIAEIVHAADLDDGKFARPETAGVDLAVRGLAATVADDHELLERGMGIFDALYAALAKRG